MVTFLKGFNKILLVMIIIKGYSILKMRIISALDIRHYKGMNATSKQLKSKYLQSFHFSQSSLVHSR